MNKFELKKLIKEELKKALNEISSEPRMNVAGGMSNGGFEEKMEDFFGNNFQNLSLKDIQKKFSSYQVSEGTMGDEDLVYSKGKEPKSYNKENLIDRAVKFIHNTVGINLYGLFGLPGAVGLLNVIDWSQLGQLGDAGNPMAIAWAISAIASMLISWATKKYFRLK